MVLHLNTRDRILLGQLLPAQGSFATLRIVREMQNQLSFSEDEHKALKIREENGRLWWDQEGDAQREFSFGEKAWEIIKNALKKADAESTLTIEHLPLYETIVGEK